MRNNCSILKEFYFSGSFPGSERLSASIHRIEHLMIHMNAYAVATHELFLMPPPDGLDMLIPVELGDGHPMVEIHVPGI